MEHNDSIELPPYQKHLGWRYMPEENFDKEFPVKNVKSNKNKKKECDYGES